MRISDWISDVGSSDLLRCGARHAVVAPAGGHRPAAFALARHAHLKARTRRMDPPGGSFRDARRAASLTASAGRRDRLGQCGEDRARADWEEGTGGARLVERGRGKSGRTWWREKGG